MRFVPAALILLAFAERAAAHRLDEYLQATTVSVERDRIMLSMRFTPGVAVAPFIVAAIDRDADGVISDREESGYTAQVLQDLSLAFDGNVLPLRLDSKKFAGIGEMREGLGEIQLEFSAGIPYTRAGNHRIQFDNKHQNRIGAYLVNALAPSDPHIRITAQSRNYQQSSYRLDYSQTEAFSDSHSFSSWPAQRAWLIALALLMTTRFAFLWWRRAGVRHECGAVPSATTKIH